MVVIKGYTYSLIEDKNIIIEYGSQVRRAFDFNSETLEQSLIETRSYYFNPK